MAGSDEWLRGLSCIALPRATVQPIDITQNPRNRSGRSAVRNRDKSVSSEEQFFIQEQIGRDSFRSFRINGNPSVPIQHTARWPVA
jgi:hypothetical protein